MKLNSVRFSKSDCVKTEEVSPKKRKKTGTIPALLVSTLAPSVTFPLSLASVAGMQKVAKGLTPENKEIINKIADEALIKSGLDKKGVTITDVAKEKISLFDNKLKDSLFDLVSPQTATIHGKNAYFSSLGNSIVINRDKLPTSIFHEMGHAKNYNMSKIWKFAQSSRSASMALAGLIAIVAAFTKPAEAKDGKELTKGQKVKNFARKNAGVLAFSAMLPVILEECKASINGAQMAKASNLPKELLNKVRLTNAFGALSYIAAGVGMGLAAKFAVDIKDKYHAKNKEIQAQKAAENNTAE